MYAVFADSATAGSLGGLYLASRFIYPWVYMVLGSFGFKFEF